MIAVAVILRFLRIVFVIKSVNDDDFNFHFSGMIHVNAVCLIAFTPSLLSASPARLGASSTNAP